MARRWYLSRVSSPEFPSTPAACQVLTVASNKGGVGKTTVATNLAIFLRALDEDLPILLFSFDDQQIVDRMLRVPGDDAGGGDLATGWAEGSFEGVVRVGQFGVDWIASAPDPGALSRVAAEAGSLRERLEKTRRGGVVIIDTKPDLGPLTQAALGCADLVITPVADQASLLEVPKLLRLCPDPRRVRVLQTLVDRRTRVTPSGPLLARALRDEIHRRGWRRFDVEISRSPRVELLNSESDRPRSLLHEAKGTAVHREFRALAGEVTRALAAAPAAAAREPRARDAAGPPASRSEAPATPDGVAPGSAPRTDTRSDPRALLSWFRSRWDTS